MNIARLAAAATVAVLGLADVAQTTYALTRPGSPFVEVSPLPAAIAGTHGVAVMVSVGLSASLLLASCFLVRLPTPATRWTLWAGAGALTAWKAYVVVSNAAYLWAFAAWG